MLAKKQLPIDKIMTHQLPLSDFARGIEMVHKGSDSVKVSLKP